MAKRTVKKITVLKYSHSKRKVKITSTDELMKLEVEGKNRIIQIKRRICPKKGLFLKVVVICLVIVLFKEYISSENILGLITTIIRILK